MNIISAGIAVRGGSRCSVVVGSLALAAILAMPVRDASARIYAGGFNDFPVLRDAAASGALMAQRPDYPLTLPEAAIDRAAANPRNDRPIIRYAGAERPPPSTSSIRPEDIVGRWGYASYRGEEYRARATSDAELGCRQPYVINRSPSGGVVMLGHDSFAIQDMTIKGSFEGKTYIGPGPDPGSADDREVVSFDGRVLITRWVDPEVASRYGFMVLVRCPS